MGEKSRQQKKRKKASKTEESYSYNHCTMVMKMAAMAIRKKYSADMMCNSSVLNAFERVKCVCVCVLSLIHI